MTPATVREALRKAAVQAVWSAAHDCTCSTDTPARHCTPCNICLDAIAAAVLAAAVEGMTMQGMSALMRQMMADCEVNHTDADAGDGTVGEIVEKRHRLALRAALTGRAG